MQTNGGQSFTVKEILQEIVLPKLDTIDRKLDDKASVVELESVKLSTESLTAWRNRLLGAVVVVGTIEPFLGVLLRHYNV